ncbi:MAG TPA: substrate-binding domain-containing protein [Terriglobia bacterium]|nr:substrate-binding domain-containing protein [Terriglobia bacterium]
MLKIALAVLLAVGSMTQAAELKVLSVGSINPGLSNNGEEFKKNTGNPVTIQVDTAPGLSKRLASGETADILIATADVLDEAAKAGKIVPGTRTLVARVGVGMTVRKGASLPEIKTPAAMKQVLENADSIVYNEGSSGLYLDRLFTQMGIAEKLKAKTTRYPNGGQVAQHVVNGKGNEIGFLPVSYILSNLAQGIQYVGPLPGDTQNYTSYEAAAMTGGKAVDSAREFIKYLTSAGAKKIFAASGVD